MLPLLAHADLSHHCGRSRTQAHSQMPAFTAGALPTVLSLWMHQSALFYIPLLPFFGRRSAG